MEARNRKKEEDELTYRLLAMWLLLSDYDDEDDEEYESTFWASFYSQVGPVLSRVYGRSRVSLASQFGWSYEQVSGPDDSTIFRLPGLSSRLRSFGSNLLQTLRGWTNRRAQDRRDGKEPRPFGRSNAKTIAVTTITSTHSRGEFDAAKDIERYVGTRLVCVWRTKLGACPACEPLDWTWIEWRVPFPDGPPAHPNCNCWVEWRHLLQSSGR